MMRTPVIVFCLLLQACGSESPGFTEQDPFQLGQALIEASLNHGPANLSFEVAPGLKLQDFPIRHPRGSQWERNQIEMVQSIDESVIFHVGLYVGSTGKSATFWLENVDGKWIVSGWSPDLKPMLGAPTLKQHWPPPESFSGSALRGIPDIKALELPTGRGSHRRKRTKGAEPRVRSQIVQATQACNRDPIRKQITTAHRGFASCYRETFTSGTQPRGRVSFAMELTPNKHDIGLEETTIIQSELSECLEKTLTALSLRHATQCEFILRIFFTPQGK
jgi:hypothetical protein